MEITWTRYKNKMKQEVNQYDSKIEGKKKREVKNAQNIQLKMMNQKTMDISWLLNT